MKELKQDTYKGTRILIGNSKRNLISQMTDLLIEEKFEEISIPIIQLSDMFKGKVGTENNNMMYNFSDRGGRNLCLAPEYTAVVQNLSKTVFKYEKNVMLFYVQECFRGEKPQKGRYRQFTQLGVEVLNPTEEKDWYNYLLWLTEELISLKTEDYDMVEDVTRGLDYYTKGKGFEVGCEALGSSKQVCGGGEYDGGVGFAIGIDRLILV